MQYLLIHPPTTAKAKKLQCYLHFESKDAHQLCANHLSSQPGLGSCSMLLLLFFLSLMQAVFIGMMISSSLWGNISDKYGRKTVSSHLSLHSALFICFL